MGPHLRRGARAEGDAGDKRILTIPAAAIIAALSFWLIGAIHNLAS